VDIVRFTLEQERIADTHALPHLGCLVVFEPGERRALHQYAHLLRRRPIRQHTKSGDERCRKQRAPAGHFRTSETDRKSQKYEGMLPLIWQ
jgi:hypothetical protein